MALNELTWFNVTGYIYDVEQPSDDASSTRPQLLDVSAFIDFFPGTSNSVFNDGFALEISNLDHGDGTSGMTMVPLAPITARMINGALCAIAIGDPVGEQLLANSPILGLAHPLYYHTRFRNVTYGGAVQQIAPFAWMAPTGQEAISNLVASPSGSGGTLPAGATYWGVTAVMPWGETAVSNVVSETLSGTTSSVALTWAVVTGATGYNIYRGAAANALTTQVAASQSGTGYTDTGAAGTALSAPLIDQLILTSPTLPQSTYYGP